MNNKELLRQAFEGLAQGEGAAFIALLADDVTWTIPGTTPWSGVVRGKSDVLTKIFAPLREHLMK